jgi:hypothetical protein
MIRRSLGHRGRSLVRNSPCDQLLPDSHETVADYSTNEQVAHPSYPRYSNLITPVKPHLRLPAGELLLGVEPSGATALEGALKFIGDIRQRLGSSGFRLGVSGIRFAGLFGLALLDEPLLLGLLGNSCGRG